MRSSFCIAAASPVLPVSLALMLGGKPGAWRQRLREWCYDAPDKKGEQRREVVVEECFAPLLRWILSWWKTTEPRLVLVLDSSTLSDRLTLLAVSVAYRGRAIPVAWHLRPMKQPGSWRQEWLRLLASLQGVIPADWMVLVMADRGLYAPWLYQAIQQQGWHPFLRIKEQGTCRRMGEDRYVPLSRLLEHTDHWSGKVRCFQEVAVRLDCSLVAARSCGYTEEWLLVTDLEPHQAQAAWYQMRFWIEPSLRC